MALTGIPIIPYKGKTACIGTTKLGCSMLKALTGGYRSSMYLKKYLYSRCNRAETNYEDYETFLFFIFQSSPVAFLGKTRYPSLHQEHKIEYRQTAEGIYQTSRGKLCWTSIPFMGTSNTFRHFVGTKSLLVQTKGYKKNTSFYYSPLRASKGLSCLATLVKSPRFSLLYGELRTRRDKHCNNNTTEQSKRILVCTCGMHFPYKRVFF